MPKDDLTSVQRFVLLTLMIKTEAVPNPVFTSLKTDQRKDLEKRGLIEIVGERPMRLELTQRGHDRALEELGAEQPARTGSAGLALYTALEFLRRLLDHTGADPRDLFRLRLAAPVTPAAPIDLDERIRAAYASLAGKPGDFVMLDELRGALPDVPTADLDSTLIAMNRSGEVRLLPESNQKALTPRQRQAAISVGNEQKHLLGIGA